MNFLSDPSSFGVWIAAILLSLSVHEFSHAAVAKLLGDDTAEQQGRLTLNPLSHVDYLGLFMLVVVGFGWGKPVPFDETRLRYPRLGPALVAGAGPLSNLLFARFVLFVSGVFSSAGVFASSHLLIAFFQMLVLINLGLMMFNLLPIPPLDGSKWLFALLPDRLWKTRAFLELYGTFILLGLLIVDSLFDGVIFQTIFRSFLRVIMQWIA